MLTYGSPVDDRPAADFEPAAGLRRPARDGAATDRPGRDRSATGKPVDAGEILLADLERERVAERRRMRWAVLVAFVCHVVLLAVNLPEIAGKPQEIKPPSRIRVVPQLRFQPPPPASQKPIPKRRTKRIPIPDPTPDEPEPIVVPEVELPEIDFPEIDDVVFGIPGPPPGLGAAGDGPVQIGAGIRAPEKIYSPRPLYTEEARRARIQGIVILQTVIDVHGNVTEVTPIKGLTLGLTESAVETVGQWKFKPATRDGKPVAVYLHVTVRFSLQ